jgi:hypothetical protein
VLCRSRGIKLLIVRSYGLMGYMRVRRELMRGKGGRGGCRGKGGCARCGGVQGGEGWLECLMVLGFFGQVKACALGWPRRSQRVGSALLSCLLWPGQALQEVQDSDNSCPVLLLVCMRLCVLMLSMVVAWLPKDLPGGHLTAVLCVCFVYSCRPACLSTE